MSNAKQLYEEIQRVIDRLSLKDYGFPAASAAFNDSHYEEEIQAVIAQFMQREMTTTQELCARILHFIERQEAKGAHPFTTDYMYSVIAMRSAIKELCLTAKEPAQKHDGKLDDKDRGRVSYISINGLPGIVIENDLELDPNYLRFRAEQALSLRDWLIQETPELERLAKGEGVQE